MTDVLSTLGTIISTAKQLREISKKIQDAEARNLVADLNLQLADLKMQVVRLQEENLNLRDEIKAIRQTQDLRSKLQFRDNVYFLKEPVEGRPEGPYCPRCLDVDNALVLLAKLERVFHDVAKYTCNNCKGHY